jgi:two-component system sensor histidine kinase KdpD
MVSHELRTPITTILGNASVLVRRQNTLSPGERFESLSDLFVDAKRLNQIVENLLVLARLESGKEVEAEPALVSRAIRRVLHEARKSNPGREYRFQGVKEEPIASGVEPYIEQVMRNYLSNAAKFSESGTRIDVTLKPCGDEVCVRVLDRGVGLAQDDIDHVFEPFYRSEKTAETTSGVGIGLTVCKRLIEAQGGRVWASARPGGGMEFGFSVPVVKDEP